MSAVKTVTLDFSLCTLTQSIMQRHPFRKSDPFDCPSENWASILN